jgi:uncharacterized zinc-type alcohol dehydrogenase-like protein
VSASAAWSTHAANARSAGPARSRTAFTGSVGTYNVEDVDGTITQGGYSQKVVVNERFVCRIPDSLDFDVAAPLLCAGITTYAAAGNRWGAGEQKNGAPKKVAVARPRRTRPHGRADRRGHGLASDRSLTHPQQGEADALALGATRMFATTEDGFFRRSQRRIRPHPQHDQRRHPRRQATSTC